MWRVVPGQLLAFREWDGEVVLFNDLSGNTHLLEGAALDVLHALQAQPADTAALAQRLAPHFDLDDDADLPAVLSDLIASLARLDLVETC
jgi:PqqD family protein of HPr-rel-A system